MGTVLAAQWNSSGDQHLRPDANASGWRRDLWSTRASETGMAFFAVSGKMMLGSFDIPFSDAAR